MHVVIAATTVNKMRTRSTGTFKTTPDLNCAIASLGPLPSILYHWVIGEPGKVFSANLQPPLDAGVARLRPRLNPASDSVFCAARALWQRHFKTLASLLWPAGGASGLSNAMQVQAATRQRVWDRIAGLIETACDMQ